MTDSTENESDPTARERQLVGLLREARDQMVELKTHVDGEVKRQAIGESLDYVIIAIDQRIRYLGRAVGRATIGTDADDALRLPGAALPEIFETALRGHGYEIVKADDLDLLS